MLSRLSFSGLIMGLLICFASLFCSAQPLSLVEKGRWGTVEYNYVAGIDRYLVAAGAGRVDVYDTNGADSIVSSLKLPSLISAITLFSNHLAVTYDNKIQFYKLDSEGVLNLVLERDLASLFSDCMVEDDSRLYIVSTMPDKKIIHTVGMDNDGLHFLEPISIENANLTYCSIGKENDAMVGIFRGEQYAKGEVLYSKINVGQSEGENIINLSLFTGEYIQNLRLLDGGILAAYFIKESVVRIYSVENNELNLLDSYIDSRLRNMQMGASGNRLIFIDGSVSVISLIYKNGKLEKDIDSDYSYVMNGAGRFAFVNYSDGVLYLASDKYGPVVFDIENHYSQYFDYGGGSYGGGFYYEGDFYLNKGGKLLQLKFDRNGTPNVLNSEYVSENGWWGRPGYYKNRIVLSVGKKLLVYTLTIDNEFYKTEELDVDCAIVYEFLIKDDDLYIPCRSKILKYNLQRDDLISESLVVYPIDPDLYSDTDLYSNNKYYPRLYHANDNIVLLVKMNDEPNKVFIYGLDENLIFSLRSTSDSELELLGFDIVGEYFLANFDGRKKACFGKVNKDYKLECWSQIESYYNTPGLIGNTLVLEQEAIGGEISRYFYSINDEARDVSLLYLQEDVETIGASGISRDSKKVLGSSYLYGEVIYYELKMAPVLRDLMVVFDEDESYHWNLESSDDGDVEVMILVDPNYGNLAYDSDKKILTYTPNEDFFGSDIFNVQLKDMEGNFNTFIIEVEVKAVDDEPKPQAKEVNMTSGNTYQGQLASQDIDGDTLTYTLLENTNNGALTLNVNGSYSYTPDTGYSGTDKFTYQVSDSNGNTAQSEVQIRVEKASTPPPASTNSSGGGGAVPWIWLALLWLSYFHRSAFEARWRT
ncbi:Ig-like domain-containing protein [Bowmanella denitrificans]|uniref:Ig-like domain-containing protein n=1 Tax=Bowmanella denitrificans TaxID=366582 RepID=UPI000C9AA704|nr:tandem-95 repeat protein [Bowmanella denitrificans]